VTSRSYLVLDIETVPDRSLPWDAAKEGFPPPTHHEIVTLGVLWLDPELTTKRLGVFGGGEEPARSRQREARLLADFVRFVGRERCHLVTYNGRSFDLPVLINRCLKHGVSFPAYFSDRDYRYRYSDLGHLDLADALTEHGATRRPSLSAAARLMGLPGKLLVDGSMIASLYDAGELETIEAHCLADVVQTAFLLLRYELLRGRLDRKGYRERARALWDAVREDERVAEVLGAADAHQVLLGEDA